MQPGLFHLNVEIGIVAKPGSLPRVERMTITDRQALMMFNSETRPAAVVIDPGTWLLMNANPFTEITP
jgi:hypothetical protein